jgi:hypothetical protein
MTISLADRARMRNPLSIGNHKAFQLSDAGLTGELKRTDVHEVTVGMAVASETGGYLSSLRSFEFTGRSIAVKAAPKKKPGEKSTPSYVMLGARVTGGGTAAEVLAVFAIDQLKSKQLQLLPPP